MGLRTRKGRQAGREQNRRGQRRLRTPALTGKPVSGTVRLEPDGSGSLIPDSGQKGSIYLPPEEVYGLRAGARVQVTLEIGRKGRVRGRLASRESSVGKKVAGILRRSHRAARVEAVPSGPPIEIAAKDLAGAKNGDAVVAEVREEARGRRLAQGSVYTVLGRSTEWRARAELRVWGQGIPVEFSAAVMQEAGAHPDVDVRRLASGPRRDLRDIPHVTIDGADARDFDDAVAATPVPGGHRVWVSIADVASYVPAGSAVDRCAAERGTSVYFPHRAVPMLPERLSSDLCCLRPDLPRLAVTCEMTVRTDGRRKDISIYPALIQSRARLTYDEVEAHFNGRGRPMAPEIVASLASLRSAAALLRTARAARGAIDLDLPETKVEFDADGAPIDVRERQRWEAHRVIEDLMIAANESVAEHLLAAGRAAVFRVHETPDSAKIATLARWAERLGCRLDSTPPIRPATLANWARALRNRPQAAVGQTLLLRSLAQARYSRENLGHFALASPAYLHFTSPIRRYPDLLVHRCLWALWTSSKGPSGLHASAEQSSACERRGVLAERSVTRFFECWIAQQHLGAELDATVIGVHRVGVFVRTARPFLEGLVLIERLGRGRGETYDAVDDMTMLARGSGHRIELGDALRVRLTRVDLDQCQIDFELTASRPRCSPSGRRGRRT